MTISRVGGVFFTAVTTVNGVTRERSEYLGGANVQNPPIYACWANNNRTAGSQFYFYNLTGQTESLGFSTRVAVPTAFSGVTSGCDFSRDNNMIAFGNTDAPYLRMIALTGGTSPLGSILTNPTNIATEILNSSYKVRFSPLNNALAISVASATRPFLVYNVTGTTSNPPLGTKLTDPTTFPPHTLTFSLDWNTNSNQIMVGGDSTTTNGVSIYPVTGSPLSFGTRIAVASTGNYRQVTFSSKGDMVGVATLTANTPVATVQIYPWDGTAVGTRYSNPITFPNAHAIAFSPDQKYVAIGHASPQSGTTWLRVYNWLGSDTSSYAFGSAITLAFTTFTSTVRELRWFGNNDRYLFGAGGTLADPRGQILVWGANGASGNIAYKRTIPISPNVDSQAVGFSWQ